MHQRLDYKLASPAAFKAMLDRVEPLVREAMVTFRA